LWVGHRHGGRPQIEKRPIRSNSQALRACQLFLPVRMDAGKVPDRWFVTKRGYVKASTSLVSFWKSLFTSGLYTEYKADVNPGRVAIVPPRRRAIDLVYHVSDSLKALREAVRACSTTEIICWRPSPLLAVKFEAGIDTRVRTTSGSPAHPQYSSAEAGLRRVVQFFRKNESPRRSFNTNPPLAPNRPEPFHRHPNQDRPLQKCRGNARAPRRISAQFS